MSYFKKIYIRGQELFGGATEYDVKVSADGEMGVTSTERERNVFVHMNRTGIAATTYFVLIDLSDTTNFPHDATGRIDISWLKIELEKDAANQIGSIRIGHLVRIDGTDADVNWLHDLNFHKGQTQYIDSINNFSPSQLKFDTTRYITEDVSLNLAAINTGVTLGSPNGLITAAVGDVIVCAEYVSGGTSYNFDIEALYHGEA